MALQPFRDEELNYFKFLSLVLNEFPKALRHAFKVMWDETIGHRPGFQLWDDYCCEEYVCFFRGRYCKSSYSTVL